MQHAVDAKAHIACVAPRLEVDIARTLLERIVEQPVADMNDVLIVGVELAAAAELDELLEVGNLAVRALVFLARALDRLGQIEKFDDVILNVERVRNDAFDFEPQDLLKLLFPVAHERFARRNRCFARSDAYRQDTVTLRVSCRHQLGDRGKIDLERVDVQVGQPDFSGQPLREHLEMQDFSWIARVLELLLAHDDQRVVLAAIDAAIGDQALGVFLRYQLIGDEVGEHAIEREAPALLLEGTRRDRWYGVYCTLSHDREYKRFA